MSAFGVWRWHWGLHRAGLLVGVCVVLVHLVGERTEHLAAHSALKGIGGRFGCLGICMGDGAFGQRTQRWREFTASLVAWAFV